MFDIEKELKELGTQKHLPDKNLMPKTLQAIRKQNKRRAPLRFAWAACSATAVVLAAIILFTVLPVAHAASYYTVDINPSISLEADGDNIILSAKAENGDAEKLLTGMSLTGLDFTEALRLIIQTAEQQGYLKENGHVLVAHFSDTAQVSNQDIADVISGSTNKNVRFLLLQSTVSDYKSADKQNKKAGVELLLKDARGLGIEETDIDTVIDSIKGKSSTAGNKNNSNAQGNKETPANTPGTETESPGSSASAGHSNNAGETKDNGKDDNKKDNNNNNSNNDNNGKNNGSSGKDHDQNGNGNGQGDDKKGKS